MHRFLASRQQEALAEREGVEAVRGWHLRVAEHLVERPGPLSDLGIAARHRDMAGDRAGALEMYVRWAVALRDGHAYAACREIANEGLYREHINASEPERVAAANLWLTIHDASVPLGELSPAASALDESWALLGEGSSEGARNCRAGIHRRKASILAQSGYPREAQEELERALTEFTGERERAVTLGDVARWRAQAGDVSGALKLHQYDLALLDLKQEKPAEALERLAESWNLLCRIGRAEGIANVGWRYGQLLAEAEPSRALEILRTSRDAFRLLGMAAEVNETDELIRRLEQPEQPPAQPRPSLWQKLKRTLTGGRKAPGGGASA